MTLWDKCRRDFEPDGALRDIYVLETTIEHWSSLYKALLATYRLEYLVDSTLQHPPEIPDEAFAARSTSNPMLRFLLGSATAACHFFTTDEIELDIDPREITSQSAFEELLGLLRLVGDTLGKEVILCYENDEKHPFITYEPSSREFEYHEYVG